MVKTKIACFNRQASLQGKRRRVVQLRDEFLDLRIQRASITNGAQPA
jgi:hypothetical protein